jgi:hypothetical protein
MRVRARTGAVETPAAAEADPLARRYLYCIIRTPEPVTFAAPGVAGTEHVIHTVNFRDLGVVVSTSPLEYYESTRRNMTSHMKVLEEVMRSYPLLPIRFNSISPGIDSMIRRFLTPNYDDLLARLDGVTGRVEMGVKAFWRDDILYNEIVEENDDIRRLRDKVATRPPESAYRERIRLGEMTEKALLAKRERESARLVERLQPCSESMCLHEPVSETMALNAAFLVKIGDQSVFERNLNELDAEMGHRVRFKCVGPVPPYNFVQLTLG